MHCGASQTHGARVGESLQMPQLASQEVSDDDLSEIALRWLRFGTQAFAKPVDDAEQDHTVTKDRQQTPHSKAA